MINLKHQIWPKILLRKRTVIIANLVTCLLLVAGGLSLSNQAWNDYKTGYEQLLTIAKADINKLLLDDFSTGSTAKLNDMASTQSRLAKDVDSYCKVNSLISWQGSVNQFSDKITSCNQQKDKINELIADIGKVVDYLTSEQKLAEIIKDADTKTNQNNKSDKWVNVESYWRQAADDTLRLDSNVFGGTKDVAVIRLTGMADCWKALASANKAKNRVEYEKAHINLNKAYALLTKISDKSEAEVKILVADLNASYANIE